MPKFTSCCSASVVITGKAYGSPDHILRIQYVCNSKYIENIDFIDKKTNTASVTN